MTTSDTMLFGEPIAEDEYLCDTHGARLSYHHSEGWICPECVAEEREAEREQCRIEAEQYEKDNPFPSDERSGCKLIRGNGFVAFHCTMPWWA